MAPFPVTGIVTIIPEDDDGFPGGGGITADHAILVPYYFSSAAAIEGGAIGLGVQDADTPKMLRHRSSITEGSVVSVHTEGDSTSYQNTSGSTAYAAIIILCAGGGTEERHVKVYSSPNDNSTTSATLLFEFGANTGTNFMDANGEKFTTPKLAIQTNHYLVVENVDDSRSGTNNIQVQEGWIVERG